MSLRKLKRSQAKRRHGRASGPEKKERMEKKVILFLSVFAVLVAAYFFDSWALYSVGETEATIVSYKERTALQGPGAQVTLELPDGSNARTAPPRDEWQEGDRVLVEHFRRPLTRLSLYQIKRVLSSDASEPTRN